MKDEPPPERRASAIPTSAPGAQAPPALMVTTTGLGGATHGVLAETPHDR